MPGPTLTLSLGCCDYDRTRALFDRRITIEGCDLIPLALHPEEIFHRAFRSQEFDICELSMSSHTVMTSRAQTDYVAVPAFVSRVFRHSGIYVRTDRGITKPEDLRGKTIGIPEYQITANVWIRGILQDDYGLNPADVHWRRGRAPFPGVSQSRGRLFQTQPDFSDHARHRHTPRARRAASVAAGECVQGLHPRQGHGDGRTGADRPPLCIAALGGV